MNIAVLLTTYNRKDKTLSCLESLKQQKLPVNTTLEIYLTDDMSSDGTPEAVKETFPEVHLYKGSGSLYWAGGMRATWKEALMFQHDFYLLLNDDTNLQDFAIASLISCSTKGCRDGDNFSLCIGSTMDFNGKISYGGRKLTSRYSLKSELVHNEIDQMPCDFGNANILFVPRKIVETIGILSPLYTHSLADYDFTLKARKAGFKVVVPPGFLGTCIDDHGKNWLSPKVKLKDRIKYMKSPKGLSYKEYLLFIKNHFPLSYPSSFIKLWLKTLFPVLWESFKKPV